MVALCRYQLRDWWKARSIASKETKNIETKGELHLFVLGYRMKPEKVINTWWYLPTVHWILSTGLKEGLSHIAKNIRLEVSCSTALVLYTDKIVFVIQDKIVFGSSLRWIDHYNNVGQHYNCLIWFTNRNAVWVQAVRQGFAMELLRAKGRKKMLKMFIILQYSKYIIIIFIK